MVKKIKDKNVLLLYIKGDVIKKKRKIKTGIFLVVYRVVRGGERDTRGGHPSSD